MKIPFNRPSVIGNEIEYIEQAVALGRISGNGKFTQNCQEFFCNRLGAMKSLLTTSCTDALEMCALLLDIQPGDEVIMPSFNFVSAANAFILRGARIVFADSSPEHPNIDVNSIESLITPKTRALICVHYAGMSCEMDAIQVLCAEQNIVLIEDAAHAIDAFYNGKPLGSFGQLATFSFHETKNIISGEGGLLVINDPKLVERSEIIWEKGTNRSAFFRGETDSYQWVDVGSSFLPSELIAAFLWGQLEHLGRIQKKRSAIWQFYQKELSPLEAQGHISLAQLPPGSTVNGHLFYLLCKSRDERDRLLKHLKSKEIMAVFHYLPLHQSAFFESRHDGRELPNAVRFAETIVRLPLYFELNKAQAVKVIHAVKDFFGQSE